MLVDLALSDKFFTSCTALPVFLGWFENRTSGYDQGGVLNNKVLGMAHPYAACL
jgi:hypothetical protein